MRTRSAKIAQVWDKVPDSVYLWIAIAIFAASNSVTRKITEIGEQHLVNGRNPISLCNVLFVGNICALILMTLIFHKQPYLRTLKRLTRGDWISLVLIAILSGAAGPALIFSALDNTTVTNVVLIGRLEPLITLALSFFFLGIRINMWTIAGSIVTFVGVATIAFLGSSGQTITMMGSSVELSKGELQAAVGALVLAIATVLSKLRLQHIPLGIFNIFRTGLGTIVFFVLAIKLYGSGHFAEAFSPFLWLWMLIYSAVIVVAGQLCWFAALRSVSPAEIALANSFNPIAAIAIAYIILREVPTAPQYLGGSIILIGIILNLIGSLRQRRTSLSSMMMSGFRGF